MTRTEKITAAVALLVLWVGAATPARAQDLNLARVEPGSSRIRSAMGLDPAALVALEYSRGFAIGSRQALWSVDLGMVVAEADPEDLRLRAGLQATLWRVGDWRIALGGRMIARSTSNSVYDGVGFGAELNSRLGYYRRGWFVSGLIGYDRNLVMHLEHSDWYRRNVYQDAVDGWYRGEGGILHGGVAAGLTLGVVELAARLELRRLDGGEPVDPPFVGELSLALPF